MCEAVGGLHETPSEGCAEPAALFLKQQRMHIVFKNTEGQAIKTWVNVEYSGHGLPMIGDIVLLHWGDYNEIEERYIIKQRIFDGCNTDRIECIVEKIEDTES